MYHPAPMDLHYERHGEGHGPPVVVLHGLFGSGENWRTPGRKLSAGFDVLLVDQRNHGRSPHSDRVDYPAMAADVRELLDRLGLERAHLVGHSMGGKTAMQLALETPDRVRSLVVVDMAPKQTHGENADILAAIRALDPRAIHSRGEADAQLAPAVPERGTRQFLMKSLERSDDGGFRWILGLSGLQASWQALQAPPTGAPVPDLPALFVRGARSGYVAEEDLPEIRRLFPRAEVATIPDAGHWVHVDQPERFLQVVEAFLAAH